MIERGTLWPIQVEHLAFHMVNPRSGNLSDPGTGKTPTACAWMYWLWEEHGIRTAWVMPKSLLKKNAKELLRFSEFMPDDVVIVNGLPEERAKQMASNAKVFLMGFKRFKDDWRTLKNLHPDLNALCADEVQLGYSTHSSKTTQELYRAMRHIPFFLPLTGTLIRGRLSSAYPVITLIEPGYYSSFNSFMNQHAVKDFFDKIIGWKGHDKIKAILDTHFRRASFKDVHGNANVVWEPPQFIELSGKQRVAYREFEEKALLELDDAFLTTPNMAVATMRCRQILGHPECIPHPSGIGTYDIMKGEMTGKDERLLIDLDDHKENSEPLIIYAALQAEVDRIAQLCEAKGFRVGKIHGGVADKLRWQYDEQFQAGELDVICATAQTSGVGFNWGHCNHIIGYSIDYMDDAWIQAVRRGIRGKRDIPLRVSRYEYEETVEQRISQIVESKSKDANKVDDTYQVLQMTVNPPEIVSAPKPEIIMPKKKEIRKKNGLFSLNAL